MLNYRAMQATLTVYDAQGRLVARIETNADGAFRHELPPGAYIVHPAPSEGRAPADRLVAVRVGEFTKVRINYDSGIR
jgi:hypothetical protein